MAIEHVFNASDYLFLIILTGLYIFYFNLAIWLDIKIPYDIKQFKSKNYNDDQKFKLFILLIYGIFLGALSIIFYDNVFTKNLNILLKIIYFVIILILFLIVKYGYSENRRISLLISALSPLTISLKFLLLTSGLEVLEIIYEQIKLII